MRACTIIIVNYNTFSITEACLHSIKEYYPLDRYRIIIVDNNSSDGSHQKLKFHFPEFEIIKLDKNKGYGSALNAGLDSCRTEFVLFLNSDIRFIDASLDDAIDYLKGNPHIAACGALNLNPDGSHGLSYGDFPFLWTMLCDNTPLKKLLFFLPLPYTSMAKVPGQAESEEIVDFPIGSFLLARTKDAQSIQGFDENFFLYFEETDFSYRMRRFGNIVYHPSIRIIHVGGASTRERAVITSRHFFKSWGHFLRKHKGNVYARTAKYVLLLSFHLHYVLSFFTMRGQQEPLRERIRNLRSSW
ncbi:glycosyltransferase family 2 protein [Fibrobacterota bacterium]